MAVMLVMGLIAALNLAGHRLFGDGIQQTRSLHQVRVNHNDAVQPIRNRPVQPAVFHAASQVNQIGYIGPRILPLRAGIQSAGGHHRQPVRLGMAQQSIDQKRSVFIRPQGVNCHIIHYAPPVLRILLGDKPSRVSGRKIPVVQHPDAHIPPLRFLQDDIQIPPPSRPAEVRMGAGLHAYLMNVRFLNLLHQRPQNRFFGAVLPEKRQQITSLQTLTDLFHRRHHILSPPFH